MCDFWKVFFKGGDTFFIILFFLLFVMRRNGKSFRSYRGLKCDLENGNRV